MQVDDRVSLLTINRRPSNTEYGSVAARFGASDGVSLVACHLSMENIRSAASGLLGVALSKNPGHLLNPPGEIAAYFLDEALYAHIIQTHGHEGVDADWDHHTIVLPLYGIVVPSRQIFIWTYICTQANGFVAEYYYHEVKLSRQESDLLNITWGKYRR